MIGYLPDTNVISETTRPKADDNVTRWLGRLPVLLLPSIGVYELASGIWQLPNGKKRAFLENCRGAARSSQGRRFSPLLTQYFSKAAAGVTMKNPSTTEPAISMPTNSLLSAVTTTDPESPS